MKAATQGIVGALMVCGLLAGLNLPGMADDGVWVRIHQPMQTIERMVGSEDLELRDYGGFSWGRMSAADVARLRDQGQRISVIERPFDLILGGETIDLLDLRQSQHGESLQADRGSPGWHIVQFEGPVRTQWLDQLRAHGMEVAQPVHPFAYYVWADSNMVQAARSSPPVRASAPVRADWKVQPHQRGFDARILPTMAMISRHALQSTLAALTQTGADVIEHGRLSRHFELVYLHVPGDRYLDLGAIPGVYTIQHIVPELGPRGEMSNQLIVGAFDDDGRILPGFPDWLNAIGRDGTGVIVGVVDGGIDEGHVDLAGRLQPCLGSEGSCTGSVSAHGTHVAGAVAGTGLSGVIGSEGFLRGLGVAPGAGLVNQAYGPFSDFSADGMTPQGMLRIFADSAASGALLTNNSWGPTGTPQGYDIPTMEVDYISRDALPDEPGQSPVLAVWSIMNGGGDSQGDCAPSSLGSPDEAKNLLAVGATNLQTTSGQQAADVFSIGANSAHGPACDGRRVPHVVAPGWWTDSTVPGGGHGFSGGTSMASPVVSGAIALWAEEYIDRYQRLPSPALMKAVFIAAARDLVGGTDADGRPLGHRPDRFQGFGLIDLQQVMYPAGERVYLFDQDEVFTEPGQIWTESFAVADPDQPVRMVLTWTDAPGHGKGGSAPAWVNLLDLEVETADEQIYLGNVIGEDGWSATGGQPDDRNNIEAVFLHPDQHQGSLDIRVIASLLAGDALNPHDPGDPAQDFALACYNCLAGGPAFEVKLDRDQLKACIPNDGAEFEQVAVNVAGLGAYQGNVTLSASGMPPGTDSVLEPIILEAPGIAQWTIEITDSALSETTDVVVAGDDGDQLREASMVLTLEQAVDDSPQQQSPSDQSTDLSLRPVFEWQDMAEIEQYRLQIAKDSDFVEIRLDELVSATKFSPAIELEMDQGYFWRVQAINACGGGPFSETRTFSTRLDPVAELSADHFEFLLADTETAADELIIANVGTGNLVFEIASAELSSHGRNIDIMDHEHWELINQPDNVGGFIEIGPGPALLLTGGDEGVSGHTEFGIVVPFDGTLYFDWGYQSIDSDCWDLGAYVVNGLQTVLACNSQPVEFFKESASVALESKDEFAFRVFTQDGLHGPGTLGVSNLRFEFDACNQPAMPPWLHVEPLEGVIKEDQAQIVSLSVDAQGLELGNYLAALCMQTNDSDAEQVQVLVDLSVEPFEVLYPVIFRDVFEAEPEP